MNRKYDHHLYVCDKDSNELKRHITFRELLRKHAQLAEEYSNLKRELAKIYRDNRQAYTEGKTEFVTKVMKEYSQ